MEKDPNQALIDNPYVPTENLYDTGEDVEGAEGGDTDDGGDAAEGADEAPKPKPRRRSRARKPAAE